MTQLDKKNEVSNAESIAKKIGVEVSKDSYEAYVVVEEPELQPADVQAALEANGVVYGVENDAIIEALGNIGNKVLVASGSRHSDGKDGWFERITSDRETEGEKNFGITNIYAGEVIGVIHKPVPGSVGVDVLGRKVQPKQGKVVNIFSGANVKRTETEERITLEATADGNLKISNANIEITTDFTIRQDVDYSDGELQIAGSLRIFGDVKGSGSIKVKHDVHIQGSVEDAKIIAGGNVTIKGSFVGRGDGLIRAGGNVEVSVVLNQMVQAGGLITLTKESVNAHLIASDKVVADRAIIMGGVVTAGNEIRVRSLGGETYSTTKVKLGAGELFTEDMKVIDKDIQILTKVSEQVKNEIYLLVRDRIDGNNFTAEKANQLKRLQNKVQETNEAVKQLTTKKQETSMEMNRRRTPKLIALGTIHESVVVEINGVRSALKQSYNNVTIQESNNEIIHTKNSA